MTQPAFEIRPASEPTFARWRALSRSPHSFIRALEYERLQTIELRGTVLDIGGGERANYRSLLRGASRIESINIDPSLQPTVIGDLNYPMPFADDSFDGAVSLNTFEHIKNDALAIAEMVRVIRPGGVFHVFVPFLYRVHGSPYDFHRHTATWWADTLTDLGIAPEDLAIQPIVWDPVVTAYSIIEFNPLRSLLRPLVLVRPLLARGRKKKRRPGRWSDYPMGYYLTATVR